MENEIVRANNQTLAQRDITIVTKEIKDIQAQAQRVALVYAVEIGRRLCEAKELLPHGEWGNWLANEVNFSSRSAQNFMALFNEYGSAELSIFGAMSNTQTFADLPYSKALALLAVPADEREEFAEEVKVNEISVRELNEAIAARKAAETERDDAVSDRDDAMNRLKSAQEENYEKDQTIDFMTKEAKGTLDTINQLKSEKAEAQRARDKALEEVDKATAAKRKAEEELKKAQDNPVISDDMKAELTAEAAQAERDKVAKEYEAKIKEAAERAAEAQEKADKAALALADAEKKLRMANPAVAAFQVIFDATQKNIIDMKSRISQIRSDGDEATAHKLESALAALKGQI